jgi:membrane dipeptidase
MRTSARRSHPRAARFFLHYPRAAMNRREFNLGLATLATSTLLPDGDKADALYRSAVVIDLNSAPDVPNDHLPLPDASLKMARDSGLTTVKLTVGGYNVGFHDTVGEIAFYQRLVEQHPAVFMQVRTVADIQRAKAEQKFGILFSFEGVECLEGKLENIELFRNLGVRVMQLSYNKPSPFAAGVMAPQAGGLTPLGREAVQRMNALRIAIDISHANPATTTDVLAASAVPVFMTHAGCAAVHAHPRNKTDEQIRALAQKGGVMGIYDLPYIAASPKQPTLDDYMAHLAHALKVAGEDHVAIGSDTAITPFDTSPAQLADFQKDVQQRKAAGVSAPEEDRPPYVIGLNTPQRVKVIAERMLHDGFTPRVVEKVIGGNALRLFGEVW